MRRHRLPAAALVSLAMIATSFSATAPAARADDPSPTPTTTPTPSSSPSATASAHAGLQADYYLLNADFTFGAHKATVVEQNLNVANMVPNYQRYAGVKERAGVRWTGAL